METVELGDVFTPCDPRRATWDGEVVQIVGSTRLGLDRTALLRCSDGRAREVLLRSLLRSGSRGYVRLPPTSIPSASPPTHPPAQGDERQPAPAPPERHRFTTQQQIVGGDRSCRIWRCAGCGAEQLGLGGWRQIVFPAAPSERFLEVVRDQEHTIVCGQNCAATVGRRWSLRLAPQALDAARAEGVLELLTRRLCTLAEPQWTALVRLSLAWVVDGRRQLTALGTRVVELGELGEGA